MFRWGMLRCHIAQDLTRMSGPIKSSRTTLSAWLTAPLKENKMIKTCVQLLTTKDKCGTASAHITKTRTAKCKSCMDFTLTSKRGLLTRFGIQATRRLGRWTTSTTTKHGVFLRCFRIRRKAQFGGSGALSQFEVAGRSGKLPQLPGVNLLNWMR